MTKARIQIVEDESIIAADIEEALFDLHYGVVGIASSGKDAIALAREKKPDLILMDINIEGPMDGIDTAAAIKKEFGIPIVFLTAFADMPVFNRAKELEPEGYVMKPFRQTELRTVIELALHRHAQDLKRIAATAGQEKQAAPAPAAFKPPEPRFKDNVELPVAPSATTQAVVKNTLAAIPAFSNLPPELFKQIVEVCGVSELKNFDVFVHEGRAQKFGFVMVSGRAAIFKRSKGGKELVVELLAPGDLFGLFSLTDSTEFPFSARAQGASEVLWIPREVVSYLMQYYAAFNREIITGTLQRLRRAHDFSRALAHDRVEVRIASGLLALKERFGDTSAGAPAGSVDLELTRQELAELVGTTPETISRVFARFVEDKALDISNLGKVTLVSERYLEKLASGR